MFKKLLSYISSNIAIDLGTATSLVYLQGKGIVINEPSVVAINQKTGQILAIGNEAKKMVGRTPAYIVATRPLAQGVISDFEVTEQMLKYFIEKVQGRKLIFRLRPRVIVGVPYGVTEVEKKAVRDAAKNAGAKEVFLIEEPMASAIGARLPVQEAGGNFVIDIGGGTTEVAVISLGGIVLAKSLRIAGDKLNEDIIHFAQEEYRLLIGERAAENIKIGIGSAYPLKEKKELPLRGRNLVTGLPEEIMVNNEEIYRALQKSVKQIIAAVKTTVEETPPELLADIMTKGIYLSGGGSLLRGLDILVQEETKIPTKIIEDPMTAVVRGAGMVLENIDTLSEVLAEPEELKTPK
ncbi:MAG: rod shape-determining protein [Candidatus Nealsonbacteria bacterium RIFCSPLOWO2_12_FULL_39_31]|uniref:Cell shape-determining protein MreB n=3 Tax=Candidatus Nealsoniibacteriota TaxID=1817911 RepID=A0A1G2EJY3_9BACT|nr:MAG: Rod shape-determining protein MreB [Parcubacteria group bacterium GW2011_GWA2_38_27]KKQ98053.1 MAG: Rod shape-determining protein MreB [Parcubacteria group bacterium GW2011_GWC2_39_11]OGZ19453.1 MAG: rod shape-determining protein [Candidatus Nealsonbacteria bacterium RIFCSPHIGHO2_01_FULL_38_55]OGZ21186.1 MAG: rod shape-determining protein [Candidatus Nealsonbacteria bacterium RIFCSPHIGHO2_02_38_10]OGZ21464.1 MAG: rod shape-determining protein [Candidatus Nealsonbacteria bacterium RIFCSP